MTTQQPEEPSVMDQAQDGDAGQVSRSGLYPTKDEGAEHGQDDPELAGADLDEDQSEGRGPTIEPGA